LKEGSLTLNLGQCPLIIWVFVANITNKLTLGLDILRTYDASEDVRCQTLRLVGDEVSLWSPGAGPQPSSLVVANNQEIPAQCEEVVMAQLESPLRVENAW
jgi:hypothetical protein